MCCDVCLNLADYLSMADTNCIICGRTMEFAEHVNSKIHVVPRGKTFVSLTPIYRFEWISRYGYVGVNILDTDVIVDGMNEVGLSCGLLAIDDTKYPNVTGISISILDVCSWILGLSSTAFEAIDLLRQVQIYGAPVPNLNRIIGAHIVIHDPKQSTALSGQMPKGFNFVCEIYEFDIKFYCTNGIVTNGPHFPSHMSILDSYYKTPDLIIGKHEDHSSIMRFIKLSEFKRMCLPETYNNTGLLNLLCHMFNSVDIIRGVSISDGDNGPLLTATQWCLFKDITSKIIYYRSYNNLTLRSINLNNLDFSGSTTYSEISICDLSPLIVNINP